MDEPRQSVDAEPATVSVAEAAKRLGKSVDAVRSLVRRGRLTARRGNSGQLLVTLTGGETVDDEAPDGHDEALALARDEAEHWRREAEDARVRAARAEAGEAAQRELAGELRAMLADARRPFWRRWRG